MAFKMFPGYQAYGSQLRSVFSNIRTVTAPQSLGLVSPILSLRHRFMNISFFIIFICCAECRMPAIDELQLGTNPKQNKRKVAFRVAVGNSVDHFY